MGYCSNQNLAGSHSGLAQEKCSCLQTLHSQALAITSKHTEDDLQNLAKDGLFRARIAEQSFQIFLNEALPAYWKLQLDLLVAVKFIFDRARPREAQVIFPNRSLRYPNKETAALLKLRSIETVYEGIQVWVEHLVQVGMVRIRGANWQTAFKRTQDGYQMALIQPDRSARHYKDPCTASQQSAGCKRRLVAQEMTKTIEMAFGKSQLAQGVSRQGLKEGIIRKARDLLPHYMDPVPLNFAIYNYKSLMKTSYDAGVGIEPADVAIEALIDAKESVASGLGSKVNIVIVEGTVPLVYTSKLAPVRTQISKYADEGLRIQMKERVESSRICFATLPGSSLSDIWHKLDGCGSLGRGFCNHTELPADLSLSAIKGTFLRKLLVGTVDWNAE